MTKEIQQLILKLLEKEHRAKEDLKRYQEAIATIRAICTHTYKTGNDAWEFKYSDHNHSYYQCGICGKEEMDICQYENTTDTTI